MSFSVFEPYPTVRPVLFLRRRPIAASTTAVGLVTGTTLWMPLNEAAVRQHREIDVFSSLVSP
jgi:hypothetical protein